jgi:Ser-tRNA(Ala) deacylase AlaX
MATQLVYMEDFDVVTCAAVVTAVEKTEDGRISLQLDRTCFYPRGGGQDWDEGTVANADGSAIMAVREVRLDENGEVHHLGTFENGALKIGDEVRCSVNKERRSVNTRLHSAGHVVDMAVDQLGLDWVPGKGGHYPYMSFVEYSAELDPVAAEELRSKIEAAANQIIQAGSRNTIRFMQVDEMHTVCRHVPENIPKNKPARIVMYSESFGIPCGGTHVRDVHDVGHITITKLKSKQGITKVSYAVEGIN